MKKMHIHSRYEAVIRVALLCCAGVASLSAIFIVGSDEMRLWGLSAPIVRGLKKKKKLMFDINLNLSNIYSIIKGSRLGSSIVSFTVQNFDV